MIPGHFEAFHPAVPIAIETIAGNTITLDLGGEQFAYYFHLQPGSLRVKPGDRVRRGEVLARAIPEMHASPICTSRSRLPPKPLAGEGVPYLIDRYRIKVADDAWQTRTRELPVRDMLVDFGQTSGDLQ